MIAQGYIKPFLLRRAPRSRMNAWNHPRRMNPGIDNVAPPPYNNYVENSQSKNPLNSRLSKILAALFLGLFIFILAETTNWQYSSTRDHRVLRPENIIQGKSQAPNQYRILAPLLTLFLNRTLISDFDRSDQLIIFLSIIICYITAGILFYRSSGSVPLTMLALLALMGSFSSGMLWKYRQEFFEVAATVSALLVIQSIRNKSSMYCFLGLITLVGSLNRETFVFCLTGITTHIIWNRILGQKEKPSGHIIGIAIQFAIFSICFFGLRWYFGLSEYHCEFWQYQINLENMRNFFQPGNLLHLGAGIIFAYLTTIVLGNREYLAFIIGYSIPMLSIAWMISSFYEHRVFYPLMALLIASIVRFTMKK